MDPEKLKLIRAFKYQAFEFQHRDYYDYPDGQDVMGKLIYTNKIMGTIGIFLGCSRCLSYPPIKGFRTKLFVIARTTAPYLALATTFTLTTYHATNFRKVDDSLNHFFGGAAAGALVGVFSRRGIMGFVCSVGFGLLLREFKIYKMNNIPILYHDNKRESLPSYYLRNRDFRSPDTTKRNWTKELPVETV